MNKLKSNLFVKREWGSEIIWALTDNYMAKTVELAPSSRSNLIFHQEREKSIIVVKGPLFLVYGPLASDTLTKTYKLSEGWSWYIEPGHVYRYIAIDDPVLLIEVSSPELDDGHILVDEGSLEITEADFIEPPIR